MAQNGGISALAGYGEGGDSGLRNSDGIDVIEDQGDDFDAPAGSGLVKRGAAAGAEDLVVRTAFEQGAHGLFLNIFRGRTVLAGECRQGGLEESGLIVNIAIGQWLHIAG
jgi:hypothetical protein